jgi:CheY-like chemotaxis protein
VLLSVRDQGCGIAAETLPFIFELFVQERQALDRSRGGLGLGLTIVRSLVERHGGRVSVHSDGPEKGSEFTVWLPAAVPLHDGHAGEASGDAAVAAGPSRRILVVDDNQDGAAMLAGVLTTMGHETRVAYDAPAALQAARDFPPDVAFLDIGLPVMDGYELAERLKALPGLEGVRLIALTGYGQESDKAKTRAAGFHYHLVKPVDFELLGSVLREL